MRHINMGSARTRGFTLVELLVVIAIIGILAGIVVPNVTRWIRKARVTEAVSEIKNMDTALRGMLTDARVTSFLDLLTPPARYAMENIDTIPGPNVVIPIDIPPADAGDNMPEAAYIQAVYRTMFYELLRSGRIAEPDNIRLLLLEVPVVPLISDVGDPLELLATDTIFDKSITARLGPSYMNVVEDPWGNLYEFWMGPFTQDPTIVVPLRSYRGDSDPETEVFDLFTWDAAARTAAQFEMPGQPPANGGIGFPAPRDFPVYIYSRGPNKVADAHTQIQSDFYGGAVDPDLQGGADDINNWDPDSGWELAPTE